MVFLDLFLWSKCQYNPNRRNLNTFDQTLEDFGGILYFHIVWIEGYIKCVLTFLLKISDKSSLCTACNLRRKGNYDHTRFHVHYLSFFFLIFPLFKLCNKLFLFFKNIFVQTVCNKLSRCGSFLI